MLVSVALAQAVETLLPACQVQIKWPNDLMVHGKKAAGVLAEAFSSGKDQIVVVGCGLNVNEEPSFLSSISSSATSLSAEGNCEVPRGLVLRELLANVDRFRVQAYEALATRWQQRLWGISQTLRLAGLDHLTDSTVEAVVQGVERDGSLRVLLPDGQVVRTATAEIIL